MEETIKISIGGIAFVINKDAYEKLQSYLQELNGHYSSKAEGAEIMEDIERRIAELLMDNAEKEDVVTLKKVDGVIAILGTPADIEEDAAEGNANSSSSESSDNYGGAENNQAAPEGKVSKRLFRDTNHRIIGGVCSGLAAYWKIDVVFIRLALTLIAALFLFGRAFSLFVWPHSHGPMFMLIILAYILMWIVVPKAKTVADKCAMRGAAQGIDGIEKDYYKSGGNKKKSNTANNVLRIICGAICILIALSGTVMGIAYYFGTGIAFGITPLSVPAYFQLQGTSSFVINGLRLFIWILPCLMFLYLGIRLIFNFKAPRCKPGFIALGVWIIAIVVFMVCGISAIRRSFDFKKQSVTQTLSKRYDTLYVNYAPLPAAPDSLFSEITGQDGGSFVDNMKSAGITIGGNAWSDGWDKDFDVDFDDDYDEDECCNSGVYTSKNNKLKYFKASDNNDRYNANSGLYRTKDKKRNAVFALYPSFGIRTIFGNEITAEGDSLKSKVVKDTSVTPVIKINIHRAYGTKNVFKNKVYENGNFENGLVSIKDSLITLYPQTISRDNKFSGTFADVKIEAPEGTIVVIKKPANAK